MGTLTHRALLQYIESNDLPGLKTFLDTRHLPVDDRDEVSQIEKFLFGHRCFFFHSTNSSFHRFRMGRRCLW